MAYDELYDGDQVRPLYRKYHSQQTQLPLMERNRALKLARSLIQGDADFLPMVRLLEKREYDDLLKGVRQRARAIRLFLQDHFHGDHTYERAGVLTTAKVEKLQQRYFTPARTTSLRPENIQFWYAPDIVRNEDGQFRVIEDNIGFVGGMGDLEVLAEASQALGVRIPTSRHPHAFYKNMVESYRREAKLAGGGKIILLSHPKPERWNHEDHRFEKILSSFDITTITSLRSLKIKSGELFHKDERVGFVIVNINPEEIDPPSETKMRIAGFWQSVSAGSFGVSYVPHLEFVGDKEFCISVEKLVEHYLGETCSLPTLTTLRLEKPRALLTARRNREEWVIKLCKSQSGDSVWVGRHLSPHAWTKLLNRVEKNPSEYIAQKYCDPSRFLDHAVDLRPLAVVTPTLEILSPIPWGRAAKNSKSKTNISCGGLLAPIAIL